MESRLSYVADFRLSAYEMALWGLSVAMLLQNSLAARARAHQTRTEWEIHEIRAEWRRALMVSKIGL